MINSISISNFQSHKNTTLKLDSGVNVIVGSSDSGKTAIIRALRWLVWNRPGGDAFRSSWGGDTTVSMQVGDYMVSRSKGSGNTYQINDQSFEAFGTGIPIEVQKLIDLNEINLQQQLDAPFLLASTYSPGDVALHFNKVANLNQIDIAARNVKGWISELTSEIGHPVDKNRPTTGLVKQIEDLEKKLLTFEHLQKFEIEVEVLEGLQKQRSVKDNQYSRLDLLVEEIDLIKKDIKDESELLILAKPIDRVLLQIKNRDELKINTKKLQSLLSDLHLNKCEQEHCDMYIKLEKPMNIVLGLFKDKNTLAIQFSTLNKLLSNLSNSKSLFEKETANLALETKRFKKEMGSTCLLCGSKLK